MGYRDTDVERFIGPKSAVSAGTPVDQDEENARMAQFAFGLNRPAPVHPSDNDQEHLAEMDTFEASEKYDILGRPNAPAFAQHRALHYQQMAQKQQQQAMMAQQQAMGGQQAPPGPGGASPQNRANAQIGALTPGGASNFAQAYQAQTQGSNGGMFGGGGVPPPPNLGG